MAGCGTTGATAAEVIFLHRQVERARAGRPEARAAAAVSGNRDIGNIAIIEDARCGGEAESVQPRFQDLDVHALRRQCALSIRRVRSGLRCTVADQGSPVAALDDDDARPSSLPFAFPFFGVTYRQVFVNSDGNLTFGAAEQPPSSRSPGRMTGGPPRIAPLFDDLDPSRAAGGVRVFSSADLVVSWVGVPEYSDGGIRDHADLPGAAVRGRADRVRLSGGAGPRAPWWVSLQEARGRHGHGLLRERSLRGVSGGGGRSASATRRRSTSSPLAQKFYETHDDAYDYLVIYNNMDIGAELGAVAYESDGALERLGVRRARAGFRRAVRVRVAPAGGAEHGHAAITIRRIPTAR